MSDWKFDPPHPLHWMTERKYIAIIAMQGMLAGGESNFYRPELVAEQAFKMADAMIKQADENDENV